MSVRTLTSIFVPAVHDVVVGVEFNGLGVGLVEVGRKVGWLVPVGLAEVGLLVGLNVDGTGLVGVKFGWLIFVGLLVGRRVTAPDGRELGWLVGGYSKIVSEP